MERRLVGAVVLAVALIVTLAVPRLLAPDLVARAFALPLPAPPAVGMCIDPTPERVAIVACSGPHAAEVTASWSAVDPRGVLAANPSNCQAIGFEYVGLTVVGASQIWQPMLAQRTGILTAPAEERAGLRGWSACVIEPRSGEPAVGAVHALASAPAGRPAAFGWCSDTAITSAVPAQLTPTSRCDVPHVTEYLSETIGFASFIAADPSLLQPWSDGCADLAQVVMQTADPTFGGQLVIKLLTTTDDPETGVDLPSSIVFGRCAAVITGDRRLVGSLFGWGTAPLPLA